MFIVRKWREKDNNTDDKVKKEIKISESNCTNSDFDKIIANIDNARTGIDIVHEDDTCLAFREPYTPIAKTHFVIVAKEADLQMATADAKTLGHLQLIASKIANSQSELKEGGFRIICDVAGASDKNGKTVYLERHNLTFHIIGG